MQDADCFIVRHMGQKHVEHTIFRMAPAGCSGVARLQVVARQLPDDDYHHAGNV